jgi:hypothetical protein
VAGNRLPHDPDGLIIHSNGEHKLKSMLILVAGLTTLFSGLASAQSWTLYVPPERDFRVLLPAPPTRLDASSGSVEFRADGGQQQYSVFRHDPRRLPAGASVRDDIIQRITNNDQSARSYGDGELAPNEFIFRVGGIWTMHRAIVEPGRYYELVVKAAVDERVSEPEARDFFNSFQTGNISVPSLAWKNLPGPDSCQARSSSFSRRFCEYLTCLSPTYQDHPVCKGLPPLLRN